MASWIVVPGGEKVKGERKMRKSTPIKATAMPHNEVRERGRERNQDKK